ncbi:MAG TPA: hypothetical protein VFN92_01145 [Solirubrobacterales bacterium]|nr:hypothetical protein [Solirubrobacterales bacterium]
MSKRRLNSISQGEIDRWITAPRFRAFLDAADDDRTQAMALYDWNICMSAVFFEILGYTEVTLRNAIDAQFAPVQHHQPALESWLCDPALMTPKSLEKVHDAIAGIERVKKEPTRARVVANLSFGFWRALLDRHYKQLWIDRLHRAFPNGTGDRKEVATLLARLNPFRNRLAHHEPVIDVPISKRHDELIELARLIDGDAARWLIARSSVLEILDWKPPLNRTKRLRASLGLTPRTVRFHLHL